MFSLLIHFKVRENKCSTNDSFPFQVRECVNLPVHPYKYLYACVRGYLASGKYGTSCKPVNVLSPANYGRNIIYDYDTTSLLWQRVKEVTIHSC